jgi:hypothetical protein
LAENRRKLALSACGVRRFRAKRRGFLKQKTAPRVAGCGFAALALSRDKSPSFFNCAAAYYLNNMILRVNVTPPARSRMK